MPVRKKLKLKGPALVFVTTTVANWTPVFRAKPAAATVLAQLQETMAYYRVSLVSYVLMPSHLHALLGFPRIEQLSRFMQSFKSLTSRRLKQMNLGDLKKKLYANGKFRLWKPRFDDLVVVSEDQFRTKLAYIHDNPVRGGLAGKAEDWPYSSAADWLGDSKGLLEIDKTFGWTR